MKAVSYTHLDVYKRQLQNTVRHIMGEDLITHLGLDYYQDVVEAL